MREILWLGNDIYFGCNIRMRFALKTFLLEYNWGDRSKNTKKKKLNIFIFHYDYSKYIFRTHNPNFLIDTSNNNIETDLLKFALKWFPTENDSIAENLSNTNFIFFKICVLLRDTLLQLSLCLACFILALLFFFFVIIVMFT